MGRNRKPEQRMQPGRITQKELEKMRYGEKRKTRLRRQKTMSCVVGTQVVAPECLRRRGWGCQASPAGRSWAVDGFWHEADLATGEGTTGNYRVWG